MYQHNDQHQHHLHDFYDYHYDVSTHDDYAAHHHVWIANHYFDTIVDTTDDRGFDQLHYAHLLDVHDDRRDGATPNPPTHHFYDRPRHPNHHTTTHLHRR